MIADIANEFQNITKFDLLGYFTDYRDFLQQDYSDVYNYYSGSTETIDSTKMSRLEDLLSRSGDLDRTFSTFAGKLGNVGYWELEQYCQDLRDTLERISKLPKYLRTAKTYRGYKPYIQVEGNIGGMKTVADLATELGGRLSEQELILNNDLEEIDYEIDTLSQVTALVENKTQVVVETILEQPVGSKIYGKDINRKITFTDDDLDIKQYEENVEQKCDILMSLVQGDVPELPLFGRTLNVGQTYASMNYGLVMSELQETFLQDDLFDSIEITDISIDNGDIQLTANIKTKYVYTTTKSLTI